MATSPLSSPRSQVKPDTPMSRSAATMVSRTLLCIALLGLFAASCVHARPGAASVPAGCILARARGSATPTERAVWPHVYFQRTRRHVSGSPCSCKSCIAHWHVVSMGLGGGGMYQPSGLPNPTDTPSAAGCNRRCICVGRTWLLSRQVVHGAHYLGSWSDATSSRG